MNKNKWLIICSVLLGIIIICALFFIIRKQILSKEIKAGANKIATQSIAIIYHPYNEGINQLANIIKSRVGGDVYKLEPVKEYPKASDLLIQRIKDEQQHPEKVSLKNNKLDIDKYHILFIGVPVINNDASPVMMRFALDNEHLFKENHITIPFVYYSGSDTPNKTYNFLYYATFKTIRKNGFTSSTLNSNINETDIDIWLNDINFRKSEFEKPTKEKAKQYKEAMEKSREEAKKEKELRDRVNSAPAVFKPGKK